MVKSRMKMRYLRNSPKPPNIVILNERRLRREMKELGFSCVSTCRRERQDSSPTAQNDNIVASASYAKVLTKRLLTALCAATLCLTALLLPTACDITKPQAPEKKSKEIEVFRIGMTETEDINFIKFPYEQFHPHYNHILPFLVFESLVDIINPQPSSESFRVSNDGKECIVTLPKGILFHDGTELLPDDIISSFNSYHSAQSNDKTNVNPLTADIKVDILDNRKIAFRSKYPQNFKYELSNPAIIRKDGTKTLNINGYSSYLPNGTGPYKFSGIDPINKIISLEVHNKYRLGPPQIKKIEMYYFKNMEAVAMAVMEGAVDYTPYFGNIEKETIDTSRNHTLFRWPDHYCNILLLNTASPKFSDARIRRALSLLIDRQDVAETHRGLPGTRAPTSTFMNFSFPKTEPSTDAMDGKEAMRLFREAGYNLVDGKLIRNGKQLSIKIDIGNIQGVAYMVEAARVVAKHWENAGIICSINSTTVFELKKSGEFDVIFLGVLETTINNLTSYLFNSRENGGAFNLNFTDNKLNMLREEYKNEFRDDILLEKKRAIQARLKEISPVIPLYYDYGFAALGVKFKDNEELKNSLSKDPVSLYYLNEYK